MGGWIRFGLDVVLPRACPTCDRPLPAGAPSLLCMACRVAIAVPVASPCVRCGGPAPPTGTCAACVRRSPVFASARSLGPYRPGDPRDVLARAVQQLKYRGCRALAGPLAELLAEHCSFPDDALLVPVPLHLSRLRARGYNQALLLARQLAYRRGMAHDARVLVRVRATPEQAELDADARQTNVRGAFAIRRGARLSHRVAVLVDDVLTTGATADACARALIEGGARHVHVLTVGRTP
jgi:ComF family protein